MELSAKPARRARPSSSSENTLTPAPSSRTASRTGCKYDAFSAKVTSTGNGETERIARDTPSRTRSRSTTEYGVQAGPGAAIPQSVGLGSPLAIVIERRQRSGGTPRRLGQEQLDFLCVASFLEEHDRESGIGEILVE